MSQLLPTYQRENLNKQFSADACESRRTTLNFRAELFVNHSPAAVWSFFTDLSRWSQWSPICRDCRLRRDCDEVSLGSVLEITFAVMGIILTVPSTVVEFDPPRAIAWHGEKFGIHAIHTYRFVSQAGGTLLCNEETFTGTNLVSGALMSAWYRKSKLSRQSLEGIRRELKRLDGAGQ
ncbi:MAG TPA: SRPBCC family protein [Pyrinomonadaceae bacterium]|jgi:ligand-binding SRPBCC domain-containing protein